MKKGKKRGKNSKKSRRSSKAKKPLDTKKLKKFFNMNNELILLGGALAVILLVGLQSGTIQEALPDITTTTTIMDYSARQAMNSKSALIAEDLEAYGYDMIAPVLVNEDEDFYVYSVHDQYWDEMEKPSNYCVVYAYMDKGTLDIEYLKFERACTAPEIDDRCVNFKCISYRTIEFENLLRKYPQINNQKCGIDSPCEEGYDCYSFPDVPPGMGPLCAQDDACSYYECPEGQECVVLESYPMQVRCMR